MRSDLGREGGEEALPHRVEFVFPPEPDDAGDGDGDHDHGQAEREAEGHLLCPMYADLPDQDDGDH